MQSIETVYILTGGAGRYQLLVLTCTVICYINCSLNILHPIFTSNIQPLLCQVHHNFFTGDSNSVSSLKPHFSSYVDNNTAVIDADGCSLEFITTVCHTIRVSEDPMTHTVRLDYSLFCEFSFLASMVMLLHMVGIFVGSLVGGIFNDRFGRRLGCIWSYSMMAVSSAVSALSPWFWLHAVARLVLGVAVSFTFVSNSGMVLEIFPLRHRTAYGMIWLLGYDTGYVILVGLAYVVRDSRNLQYTIALSSVVPILFPWFYQESFRWLLAHGDFKKAREIIRAVADTNRLVWKQDKLDKFIDLFKQERTQMVNVQHSFKEVFQYKTVLMVMICTWFLFFSTSFSYYTFILGSASVSKNLYLATLVAAIAAWMFRLIYMLLSLRVPRTMLLVSLQFCLLLCFIASLLFQYFLGCKNTSSSILLMMAVAVSGTNFGFMWIYGGEAFPTVVRSTGVSIGSACARVAGMLASQMERVFAVVPYALPALGAAMALAGTLLSLLLLPETLNRPSLDFLAQAQLHFQQWRQFWRPSRNRKRSDFSLDWVVGVVDDDANAADRAKDYRL